MLNQIEHERKMAQHLFYVSLKYTKTTDVILNLIARWESLLNKCIELLLKNAKKSKKITSIPETPKAREFEVRRIYKDERVTNAMNLYSLFHKMPGLDKMREGEFRKNVAITVMNHESKVEINMEKLKEWEKIIESMVDYLKKYKN